MEGVEEANVLGKRWQLDGSVLKLGLNGLLRNGSVEVRVGWHEGDGAIESSNLSKSAVSEVRAVQRDVSTVHSGKLRNVEG